MHEVLVNCFFKLAQEKSVVKSTDRPAITIAVDLGCKATKQTKQCSIFMSILLPSFYFLNLQDSSYYYEFTSILQNSADLEQLASKKPPDLDLLCFQNRIYPD